MIITRASKHSLNSSNNSKLLELDKLFADYHCDLQYYVNLIYDKKLALAKNLSSKDLPANIITHSRWKQIIYKQASEIIRANIKKRKTSRPNIKAISINLDTRVYDIADGNSFDSFLKIILPYFNTKGTRALNIKLPFRKHKQSNKYKDWTVLNCVKIKKEGNNYFAYLTYQKEVATKLQGSSIGVDSGYKKLFTLSTEQQIGIDMKDIYTKISNKKQKSKGFNRSLIERDEAINIAIKSINLNIIKTVYVEDLKNLNNKTKIGRKQMNKQQRWTYSYALNKLEHYCNENGVDVVKVLPHYTSQKCSGCSAIHRESRKGERYECISCNMVIDADYNASLNILHRGEYGLSDNEKELLCTRMS